MEEQEILGNEESLFQRAVRWLKSKVSNKSLFIVTLIATFLFGICAHGFAFFNLNVSHDSLYEFYNEVSAKQKFGIGRFIEPFFRFLTGEAYVLPWLAGVLGLTFIACGVYLMCKILSLNSIWHAILLSGVFSVNVTITALIASFIHDFSGDMLAFFLSVWVAYIRTKGGDKTKLSTLFFMALVLFVVIGIYQAYLGVTVTLILVYSLLAIVRGAEWKPMLKRMFFAVLSVVVASVAYLLVALLFEKLWGQAISTYNGMSVLSVSPLRYLIRIGKAYGRTFAILFLPNARKMSTAYSMWAIKGVCVGNWLICMINAALLLYTVCCCITSFRRSKLRTGNFLCVLLFMGLLPLSMNLIVVLAEICHDVMKIGTWLFYPIIVALLHWCGETDERSTDGNKIKKAFVVFPMTLFIIFNGIGVANTCYVKKDLDARATLSSVTRLIEDIEDQNGYICGETEVAILGNFDEIHNDLPLFELNGKELFVAGLDYNASVSYLDTWKSYFEFVVRYPIRLSDIESVNKLKEIETVKKMPVYPQIGSICEIDGVIVVKLSYKE